MKWYSDMEPVIHSLTKFYMLDHRQKARFYKRWQLEVMAI